MAVGANETVAISTDGLIWQSIAVPSGAPEAATYTAVGFGNGSFLIAGSNGSTLLSGEEPLPVEIAVSPPGAGTARVADRGVLAATPGSNLAVTATAAPGYRFTGWTGSVSQTDAALSTTVDAPLALTANFVAVTPLRVEFREGPLLNEPRTGHLAVATSDGCPVLLGGHTTGFTRSGTMEVGTGEVNAFALVEMTATADGAAVAKLADDTFLVAGGACDDLGIAPGIDTAMLLTRSIIEGVHTEDTGAAMVRPRMNARAARLADGRVLIVGGWYDLGSATYGELFTPATERGVASFAETGALVVPRSHPLVLPTNDGGAIVAGGIRPTGAWATQVEYYDPGTNTFAQSSETLFGDGEPWILQTNLPGDVGTQQRSDGTYVLWAWHQQSGEGTIVLFDPAAKAFQQVPPVPAFTDLGDRAFCPVVDVTETQAVVLTATYDDALTETQFLVHVIDLATGKRRTTTAPVTVAGYFPAGATLSGFVANGNTRLLLAGGCSEPGIEQNFYPVDRTFIFDPMLDDTVGIGEASCVSRDLHGFAEQASNVGMVRRTDGTLHVTYTRAVRAPDSPDWYCFVRSCDADGDWQPEVRTERFPDSNRTDSIVVDSTGLLHQGFTFNVGAFHTTSADGGTTWEYPASLRDGGWGSWDWNAQLARSGDQLFAVFTCCYGWEDYPANLILREWHADTGWGTPQWLTSLPNEDEAGYGASSPRFQIRPDGYGLVLYTESSAAGPTQMKLLEVGLPAGSTTAFTVSDPNRWAGNGDVAVDSSGTAHLVWRESDTADGTYELWYRTFHTATGLGTPVRLTEVTEPSVRTATVGAYPGNRVLVAYGLAGVAETYGGVFVRKMVGSTVSAAVRIGNTTQAHSPGLRSTWDMAKSNTIDLTWVEVYTWGSQLLHQRFDWTGLDSPESASVTIRSNVDDATFTLEGPLSGTFALVNGEWTGANLPAGSYTITWHAVAGQSAPPAQTFEVTGEGAVVVAASYIDENLHRLSFASSPSGTGSVNTSPSGTELLGGDRSFADGSVTFSARPVEGYGFVRWQVTNDLGTSQWGTNPLTLSVDRDFQIVAEFAPAGPFRVDTILFGNGTITPTAVVASGSRFTCTIAPAAGEQLADVLLDGVSQGLSTEVVIDPVSGPHSIQAFTEPATAEVHAVWLPEEGGNVTVSPTGFGLGDTVTVTAEPAAGYTFLEWRGDLAGSDPAASLLVDRAKSVTAIFGTGDEILGDLNRDGAISIEDAVLARRMYAGLEPVDLVRGDMDGNGRLDTADIAAILQAEARGDRQCLGGQQVAPAADKRVVSFPNGISLTLPGGWPSANLRASVAFGNWDSLPDLGAPLTPLTSVYDIRLGETSSFGREIGFEIPYTNGGGRNRADEAKMVLYLDPETNAWIRVPSTVFATAYNAGEKAGKYVVAKINGNMVPVPGTHCVVYYDPAVTHLLGGGQTPAATFAALVATQFDAVYEAYTGRSWAVPTYENGSVDLFVASIDLDRRATIYLSDTANNYPEAFYSWKTKNYYIPVSFSGADEIKFTLAHELFHALQNQSFSGPSMAVNRWLFEMAAEYASRKAAYDGPLSTGYLVDLGVPLGSLDDIHEYACAHLLQYLLDEGSGTFTDLWRNRLGSSFTPRAALESYAKEATSRSLNRLYANFLEDVLFDSALPDLAMPVGSTDWGTGNVIDKSVTIPAAESAGWMKTKLPSFASYPARVLVDLPDGVPSQSNARIYAAPTGDPKQAGGRSPAGSFFSDETLPFVSTQLGDRDSVYATAYSYFGSGTKSLRVRIRPLIATVSQEPTAAVSGTPCNFTAVVSPIPDCAQMLKVYWKPADGSAWQIDTVTAQTTEFHYTHTYQCEKDTTFALTVEVHCLDADGRRRLLVSQEHPVAVGARPTLLLSPSVAQVEIGQDLTFTAQLANGPDTPEFQWTFGDGSTTLKTSTGDASHSYAAVGNYTATVAVVDTDDPGTVVAQCSAQVTVNDPVQNVDPPADPPPAAPALDYSQLTRVDETRWWDDVREVYFLDSAGRKHGLYQSFIQSGSSSRPLEAGMYIHGRQEGRWLVYLQDGSGTIEQRHFHWDQWIGIGSQARSVTAMARIGSGSPLPVYFDDAGVVATDWPAAVAGSSCAIYYADGSIETVAFDSAGRRQGACTMVDSSGRTIMTGSFAAGVKTGDWSYYSYSGATETGVTYKHDQDPPNQK